MVFVFARFNYYFAVIHRVRYGEDPDVSKSILIRFWWRIVRRVSCFQVVVNAKLLLFSALCRLEAGALIVLRIGCGTRLWRSQTRVVIWCCIVISHFHLRWSARAIMVFGEAHLPQARWSAWSGMHFEKALRRTVIGVWSYNALILFWWTV